jgi:hypothetical protein
MRQTHRAMFTSDRPDIIAGNTESPLPSPLHRNYGSVQTAESSFELAGRRTGHLVASGEVAVAGFQKGG